jgi:carboxymethylenebutenolidase
MGGKDLLIPQDQVEAIRESLAGSGTRHEVVVYEEADHGFFCDQRPSFDAAAAADAWERVKTLFREELAG